MMQITNKTLLNSIGIIWVLANTWVSKPFSSDTTLVWTLDVAIIFSNPILFGLMAWNSKLIKMSSLLYYSIATIITWLVSPAIFAVFKWGIDTFFRFLFDQRSIGFWLYLVLCIMIYYIFTVLAKNKLKNKTQFNGNGDKEVGVTH